MILNRFLLKDWMTNCYLIGDEKAGEVAIVDPGFVCEPLLDTIDKNQYEVKAILFTHGHYDHIHGTQHYLDRYHAPLMVHQAEAPLLFSLNSQFEQLEDNPYGEFPVSSLLKDGDEIALGEVTFRVIHTPGHTPGGICLYTPGVLLSGDTLFHQSVGRWDFPYGEERALMQSVNRLCQLPEETKVYPGHGFATTIAKEKAGNPFVVRS